MKLSPLAEIKRDELAETYPKYYEVTYMNADTPRMSGEHYLKFGYKEGFSAGYAFAQQEERERAEKLVERLESARGWVVSYQRQTYSKLAGNEVAAIDEALAEYRQGVKE